MKKVEFNTTNNEVEVLVNGDSYGTIKFDADQNAWVLWPEDLDDAVTYTNDLDETKDMIKDEIESFED